MMLARSPFHPLLAEATSLISSDSLKNDSSKYLSSICLTPLSKRGRYDSESVSDASKNLSHFSLRTALFPLIHTVHLEHFGWYRFLICIFQASGTSYMDFQWDKAAIQDLQSDWFCALEVFLAHVQVVGDRFAAHFQHGGPSHAYLDEQFAAQ